MDNGERMDYIFLVHNMLEMYHKEYILECKRLETYYAKRKEILKATCRKRGLTEEEIEQLFKNY